MSQEQDRNVRIEALLLRHEIETFLTQEAELLDEREFEAWFALMADDLRYWMPVTRNVALNRQEDEHTREQQDLNWFDEGHFELGQRVRQILTGKHWVEDPVSRTCHMFSNLVVTEQDASDEGDEQGLIHARCRFIIYRNRTETETDFFVGKREDHLRRVTREGNDSFEIVRRQIFLDQNVLMAKSLSTFF